MKTFNFKWMAGMLLVMLCMGLSSCSDDDDDVDPSSLIGTWQLNHSKGYQIYDGERYDWDKNNDSIFFRFETDGTYTVWEKGYEQDKEHGNYQIKGDKLIIIDSDGERNEATIKKLTTNRLELETKESGTEDGEDYEHYDYSVFIKIQ